MPNACSQLPADTHQKRVALALVSFALMVGHVVATATPDDAIESLERIHETARIFLLDSLKTDDRAATRIELGQLDNRLRLARCAHPPTAQFAPGNHQEGNTTVNVRCSEPVAWSIFIPARLERDREVLVVAKTLSRHQLIQPDDVRLERRDSSTITHGYLDDPTAVIGQQTKRALSPGEVMNSDQVIPPKLVTRGQQVTLFSARPGLTVRMKGEAMEDGAEGQRIRVRNLSSKRIVEGYVEPSGAIRIAF